MKPILFSTPMVQAILDGRKTMTRRAIQPQPNGEIKKRDYYEFYGTKTARIFTDTQGICAKYALDDVLWVRETWQRYTPHDAYGKALPEIVIYRADCHPADELITKVIWRPSIFMPREAARIFLRVNEVRAERLQDMPYEDMEREGLYINTDQYTADSDQIRRDYKRKMIGAFKKIWDSINAKPKPQYITVDGKKRVDHYVSYPWENIQETRTWRGKPWYIIGNPWVWAISFERCDKPQEG